MQIIDRRIMLRVLAGGAIAPVFAGPVSAAEAGPFAMWRDPGCGCCLAWAARIEAAFGRKLRITDSPDMAAVKHKYGVPDDLRSCHTGLIGSIVVEGHVPPDDIKRLIAGRIPNVKGLAVPGMPAGSPGMDVGHTQKDPYEVIAFSAAGKRSVFARHR
ncbi:DUF411 domain-containing protein [Allosphingosinicella deserti]|nr:DUF411 domain-containing protein [Sphingomonas deserti]